MQRFRFGAAEIALIDEEAVRRDLDMRTCVDVVESAFAALARGEGPEPGVLGFEVPGGSFHLKAAAWPERGYFVAKTNSNYPGNPAQRSLPTIQGLLLLFDVQAGVPLAVIDSAELTARRTGAATGVAVKHLTEDRALAVTLIGCGRQARAQLEALAAVRKVERVHVYDVNPAAAERLVRALSAALPIAAAGDEWRERARDSDVVITCTPSRAPVLDLADVRAGCLVAAVGADNPHKHEIAPRLMARAQVVCDVLEQCAVMGDLHHALAAGTMRREGVHAELGDIVIGKKPGRERADDIIVFDSTGMALQDLVAAAAIWEMWQ